MQFPDAPAIKNIPTIGTLHWDSKTEPVDNVVYVIGQLVHEEMPVEEEYSPMPQDVQIEELVAPVLVEYFPATQAEQVK